MRIVLLLTLAYGAALGQSGLREYLKLTDAQAAAIGKLDSGLNDFVTAKESRAQKVKVELAAELAKTPPDARELGVRYVELASIAREEAAQQGLVRGQIAALLTPTQTGLLHVLSAAAVQQGLVADAQCAGLLDTPVQAFAFRSGDFSVVGAFPVPIYGVLKGVLGLSPASSCGPQFPISVREYLNLMDAQVAGIVAVRAAYDDLNARKRNRMADVQVEIRDETAKAVPDPVALGERYAELNSLSSEIQQDGVEAQDAARKLLTPGQAVKLQRLHDAILLSGLEEQAESCNLAIAPSGVIRFLLDAGRPACP